MSTTALTEEASQLQVLLDGFFKKNKIWSLLSFLKYREKVDEFTYDKVKEHNLYKKTLALLSRDNDQARSCMNNFVNEKNSESVRSFWTTVEKKCYEDEIEKESLGYINDVIDDSIKDSKDARSFLSGQLKTFVKKHAEKRNHDQMDDPQGHKESYKSNSASDLSKKAKTDFTFNVSFDEYTNVVNAVKSIQQDNESAYTDPLWWGVLDFREENISPSPDLPRAKSFLSTDEIDRLMIMARSTIQEEKKHISKSVESFLEALLLSEIVSLKLLAKECGARGVAGVCDLLRKSADKMQDVTIKNHLENVDVDDEATIYVGKCIEDAHIWISRFSGRSQSERTVDMFIVGPCAKTPQTIFTYGENHSDADRYDKTERSGTQRVGKACDFLYWSSSIEAGIGENSGPTHKDSHDKAKTNFVDVIKVSRAQHIEIETHIIEQSGRNPLPDCLQKELSLISIPFFQIIGIKIRFYILFQINGDLYGIWDWASESLPVKDTDVGELVLLCKRFLIHGNLVERIGQMASILSKKAKTFKDKIAGAEESSRTTIEINKLRTPAKPRSQKLDDLSLKSHD